MKFDETVFDRVALELGVSDDAKARTRRMLLAQEEVQGAPSNLVSRVLAKNMRAESAVDGASAAPNMPVMREVRSLRLAYHAARAKPFSRAEKDEAIHPRQADEEFEQFVVHRFEREDLREYARLNWYKDYSPRLSARHLSLADDDIVLAALREYEAGR